MSVVQTSQESQARPQRQLLPALFDSPPVTRLFYPGDGWYPRDHLQNGSPFPADNADVPLPEGVAGAVVCEDALVWLQRQPAESVDVIWTSPDFNLSDPLCRHDRKGRSIEAKVYAGGHGRGDGRVRSEESYQLEQVAALNAMHRVLKPDGVAFYNHKVRIKGGEAIHPMRWILHTEWTLLQEVVWDRRGTPNQDTRRFLPVSERIYVLSKRPGIKLENPDRLHDVLRHRHNPTPRRLSGHPCPTAPNVIADCLAVLPTRRFLWNAGPDSPIVLDPYAGTGNTAMVALRLGFRYVMVDDTPEYCQRMAERLATWRAMNYQGEMPL